MPAVAAHQRQEQPPVAAARLVGGERGPARLEAEAFDHRTVRPRRLVLGDPDMARAERGEERAHGVAAAQEVEPLWPPVLRDRRRDEFHRLAEGGEPHRQGRGRVGAVEVVQRRIGEMLLADGDDLRRQRGEDAAEAGEALAVEAALQDAARRAADTLDRQGQLPLLHGRGDDRHQVGDGQGECEEAVRGASGGEDLPEGARRLEVAEPQRGDRVAREVERLDGAGGHLVLRADDDPVAAEEDQPPADPEAQEPGQGGDREDDRADEGQERMAPLAAAGKQERELPDPLHAARGQRPGAARRQRRHAELDDRPDDEDRAEDRQDDHSSPRWDARTARRHTRRSGFAGQPPTIPAVRRRNGGVLRSCVAV